MITVIKDYVFIKTYIYITVKYFNSQLRALQGCTNPHNLRFWKSYAIPKPEF